MNQARTAFILTCFLYLKQPREIYSEVQDYTLNFTQIAEKLGLKCEVHEVITEDGYILELFRLPGDRTRPVFLLSGNAGTVDNYIGRGNTSLAAVLVNAGHDVWLGNWRGCKYGRRHVSLDPDTDDQFWDHSHHEFAMYDVPALIDRVLSETQTQRVPCIAWSLGTTTFYVLGALRPEYIDKVSVVISLAPFGYMHHSLPLRAVQPVYPIIAAVAELYDVQEFFRYNSTYMSVFRFVCSSEEIGFEVCTKGILNAASGFDDVNLDPEITPMMFNQFPSSQSLKSLMHLAQGLIGQRVAYFDYGPTDNLLKYGSVISPAYALHKNNMSIVLISGLNDLISTLPDVNLLKAELPNVVQHIILEDTNFNHFDFVYGKKTYKTLYFPYILGLLKKYVA